ncbi:hypothetical protein NEIFL0001_0811 [Neisseria flavescens SK114]|nr:hypothetical protein NEIFL0001_0811 [Neisseria flavescens SK114]
MSAIHFIDLNIVRQPVYSAVTFVLKTSVCHKKAASIRII